MTKILGNKACDIKIHYPPLEDHVYQVLFKCIYGELSQKLSPDEYTLFNTDYYNIEIYYNNDSKNYSYHGVASTVVPILDNLTSVPYGVTNVTIDVKYLIVSDLVTVLIKS